MCYRGIQKIQATDRKWVRRLSRDANEDGYCDDAIGYWYCTSKDQHFPGAWAPGTPGLRAAQPTEPWLPTTVA